LCGFQKVHTPLFFVIYDPTPPPDPSFSQKSEHICFLPFITLFSIFLPPFVERSLLFFLRVVLKGIYLPFKAITSLKGVDFSSAVLSPLSFPLVYFYFRSSQTLRFSPPVSTVFVFRSRFHRPPKWPLLKIMSGPPETAQLPRHHCLKAHAPDLTHPFPT